jgi:hypothetical protein
MVREANSLPYPERRCLTELGHQWQSPESPRRAPHVRASGLPGIREGSNQQILALRGIVVFVDLYCVVWYLFAAHLVTNHVFGRKLNGEVCHPCHANAPKKHRPLLLGMNGHSQQPPPAVLASTNVPISLRIADLRREIEDIQELNMVYRHPGRHRYEERFANQRRKIRLEEIMQQLAALHARRDSP